jgi:hypothetical protein
MYTVCDYRWQVINEETGTVHTASDQEYHTCSQFDFLQQSMFSVPFSQTIIIKINLFSP